MPCLYFIGLPWLLTRGSGIVVGVDDDAAHITGHIKEQLAKSKP